MQPAFLICTAVLASAGAGMSITINKLGVYLKKEPIPLKKNLNMLDENGLASFRVEQHNKRKIDDEVVKALGTEDYINWIVEDCNTGQDSPYRRCLLFITYYDCPDKVPHVPEECYAGGGFQRLASDSVILRIDNGLDFERKIQAKYLVFGSSGANLWRNSGKFPVLYFFRVNGEYASGREEARRALNKNLFGKSSYFSKVELAFNQASVLPGKKNETIAASEKILSVVLPILEKEHWPDLHK
ncbi:MAG: hypothetical protein JW715_00245 [Sedimentisphaerales bacterium]|nr:hypothetical protein [Sedimentisphaerales bacterium]